MTKLMIIAIDGLDRTLVSEYIDELPNLQNLILKSFPVVSTSVFPPDSDTAWASIYTGLNPARHGVVDFVDPLERMKIAQKESEYFDINSIKGLTFWDIASRFKKKVCLIYPHLAFPVWKVNGLMINVQPETEELQIYPSDFKFNFDFEKLKGQKRIPRTKFEFKNYLKNKKRIVQNEFDFGEKMLTNYSWDLFFIY